MVTDNAVDEFLALFSQKTLNFIRAPDENTFCAPLNLIEIILLIPLEPFLKETTYAKLNHLVMTVVYSPVLLCIAIYESKFVLSRVLTNSRVQAPRVRANRIAGLDPGDDSLGWDIEDEFDPKGSGWADRVHSSIPRIEEDEMALLRRLEKKLDRVQSGAGAEEDNERLAERQTSDDASEPGMGGDEMTLANQETGFTGSSQ